MFMTTEDSDINICFGMVKESLITYLIVNCLETSMLQHLKPRCTEIKSVANQQKRICDRCNPVWYWAFHMAAHEYYIERNMCENINSDTI